MSAIRIFDKFAKLLDVNWGSIADGQLLKRSGTSIVGVAAGGAGDVVGPAGAVDGELAIYSGTTGKLIGRLAQIDTARLGDGAVTSSKLPAGTTIQTVYAENPNWSSSAAIIPTDNTLPQIGEGTEMITLSIMPQFTTSKVLLHFAVQVYLGAANIACVGALFRDAGPNALAANYINPGTATAPGAGAILTIDYLDAPGSVSAIIYRVRIGPNATGTMFFNGSSGSRNLGGAARMTLTAAEIKQ